MGTARLQVQRRGSRDLHPLLRWTHSRNAVDYGRFVDFETFGHRQELVAVLSPSRSEDRHVLASARAYQDHMPIDLDATPAVRRRMQRTVQKDNEFERTVRSVLHARGFRYRIHFSLPGLKRTSCDIAFPRWKVAVFLDGCFWHGCEVHPPSVKRNTNFWLEKIERNRARDARASAHLKALGWTVLRFWEHETTVDIAETISAAVQLAASSHCTALRNQ